MRFLRQNILLIALFLFTVGIFAVTTRINLFRYNNFDMGKFDLGNMTQMVWNTMYGRPLYLTDYFGANVPRWAMSHVDPILLVFVPIFAIFQYPLTLVFSQIILVMSSAFILYAIALLHLKSRAAAAAFGFSFIFYPAIGFLNAWTGFHGVTAVIPFFLLAFYIFERMYLENNYSWRRLALFWVFLVLTMMGKEQLPLYIVGYGIFIIFMRLVDPAKIELPAKGAFKTWLGQFLTNTNVRVGLSMVLVGILWFYIAFFVVIPKYAHYRVDGFRTFAESIDLDTSVVRNVESPNYFLSRYEYFGDTYTGVLWGMAKEPKELVRTVLGGDKPENLRKTFEPFGYTPILYWPLLAIAFPDFLINYSTTSGGIGTSEIYNHRISMIIPILFLASIYAVGFMSRLGYAGLGRFFSNTRLKKVTQGNFAAFFAVLILGSNIYTTFDYENPVFLWLEQAAKRRLATIEVFAKFDTQLDLNETLELGERYSLSKLDLKDRECAEKIVGLIPPSASVSGPDYLGAHLSMRETYAIFPALFKEADFVIVDIFSQKLFRILELDVTIVRDVVADVLKDEDYQLKLGCGNLFVFQKVGVHGKSTLLPIQERFVYEEVTDLEIFQDLHVVDYYFAPQITRGQTSDAQIVYTKRENTRLDGYVLFMTFINDKTSEMYQVANLPSFSLDRVQNWKTDRYYIEDMQLALPEFLDAGTYRVFIGMSNEIRTRSIYLGDVIVR